MTRCDLAELNAFLVVALIGEASGLRLLNSA